MTTGYAGQAIKSVLSSDKGFCKFLSANDTGATGGHQSGILISKSAVGMMFSRRELEQEGIPKRTVKIKWLDDFETESSFTYYESKNELRITRFGRGFPFLKPEQTGALFVFTKQSDTDYSGYFLETDEEIEEFLDTFGISPTETNSLIDVQKVSAETQEKLAIQEFISSLDVDFPSSDMMSVAAREIEEKAYDHAENIRLNPDEKIISWTNMEYTLFRALEYARYGEIITKGFQSVDEFVRVANVVLNRRKSRAGKSLEHHLAAIFDGNCIEYSAQAVTEGNKKPDFLFPSQEAYHDYGFSTDYIVSLAAKTTCKDRWRQVLNEADRLRDKPKYLCTLQQGISGAQMDEMQAEDVILVVPKPYIQTYPKDRRDRIWTLTRFVQYVKMIEGK
ncbi:type II restriction endonuclease [Extibacter muris]|uniref:Restriction endonuclease n=1 Tax=Extibacter muris TaxID=1796622 RepID=A0A4R4FD59_9FIRM|nr:type II restriction endonuclease [Extibacter muris]MCU0080328.1 type II restriction endonuclease [Extibacter muris]TDA21435.1 restriction endonuclease [Extibacter muris]